MSDLTGVCLLIVEDDVWIRRVLVAVAKGAGASVVEAGTLQEAVDRAADCHAALVDLVLADGESGEDVALRLAEADVPCIAITGDLDALKADRGGDKAFRASLVKPVGSAELAGVIREVLNLQPVP